ncbi:MAG TPA: DNA phosphorothioation-associated putative methyltransferase [Bryobacteraceae bacterium]|jgi:DNA phosphorothioation-associated putative methyltransferase
MGRNHPGADEPQKQPAQIPRHRTAIRRGGLSRPVALARAHGLIGSESSFFDYGCGLGEDVTLLKAAGIRAEGWDPYYLPGSQVQAAECVNLGYVLNVIEDPKEREETLRSAYTLASKVLVVSVRVDQTLSSGADFSDGRVTNSGSFQKIFSQRELREYIQSVLDRKPYMAGLGIAYVFKDETAESGHLARLSITPAKRERIDLFAQFASDAEGQALLEATRTLGRLPLPSEFDKYSTLEQRFGSRARLARLVTGLQKPESVEQTRQRKKNDILTFLAMLFLRGVRPPRIGLLPPETQADIKLFWPSYKTAMEEGREFLFGLAKPELIREACVSAPVGKRLPTDFYLHQSAEDSLPALLRVLLFASRQVVGDVDYNIVKIAMDGRKVSFLKYKNFDENAHPELLHSVRVHLPSATYTIRDYSASDNPPVLHRKEAFVDPLYPEYAAFAHLTEQEEKLGLLSAPNIGFKNDWLKLLNERNISIVGHQLRGGLDAEKPD